MSDQPEWMQRGMARSKAPAWQTSSKGTVWTAGDYVDSAVVAIVVPSVVAMAGAAVFGASMLNVASTADKGGKVGGGNAAAAGAGVMLMTFGAVAAPFVIQKLRDKPLLPVIAVAAVSVGLGLVTNNDLNSKNWTASAADDQARFMRNNQAYNQMEADANLKKMQAMP